MLFPRYRGLILVPVLFVLLLAIAWVRSFGGKEDPVTAPPTAAPVRRALFVMAHQDDEFGVFGRLLQLRDSGAELWCVWTVGGNPLRDAEATRAMASVGVPEGRLIFLTVGGLGSASSLGQTIKALSGFLTEHPCDEIYVTAFEGGHFQHDLTHYATVQAAHRSSAASRIYEYPLYNLAGARVNLFRLAPGATPVSGITLAPERVALIRGLARHYPSQRHITEGFLRLMPYSRQSQPRWRAIPSRDYAASPHPGLLWHDANPRHSLNRSYQSAVRKTIAELCDEPHITPAGPSGSPP